MEWGIGKTVLDEPTTHLANHVHIIVDTRNDEVGEFYPHPGFVHREDSVKYGLEMTTAYLIVYVVAERFQVDIGSIKVGQEVA